MARIVSGILFVTGSSSCLFSFFRRAGNLAKFVQQVSMSADLYLLSSISIRYIVLWTSFGQAGHSQGCSETCHSETDNRVSLGVVYQGPYAYEINVFLRIVLC